MLQQRLLTAVVLVLALIGAMSLDYYWIQSSLFLHLLFLAATYLSFIEFWPLCRAAGHQTYSVWATVCGCLLVVAHYWSLQITHPGQSFAKVHFANNILQGAMATAVLGAFVITARRKDLHASLGGLGVTCLGLIYLWFLPSYLLKLRHLGEDGLTGGVNWNVFGSKMVVATIVIAKGCDVMAYLIGRQLGKHKAFPLVSPGKTIEGLVGGLLGSCLLALLLRMPQLGVLPAEQFNWLHAALLGLLIGFSGMLGDLSESLIKRSAGVKDASSLVPGYGGVLDVIDSMVVAGPVAYFLVPIMIT